MSDIKEQIEWIQELLSELQDCVTALSQTASQSVKKVRWEERALSIIQSTPGVSRAFVQQLLRSEGCQHETSPAVISILLKKGVVIGLLSDGTPVPPYYRYSDEVALYVNEEVHDEEI